MNTLFTALTTLFLVATPFNALFASQHGMSKEDAPGQTMEMDKKGASQMQQGQMMNGEGERAMEQERERDQMMDGEGKQTMEKEREMEQKTMGEGTEEGEKKKERKWWRFWE